MKRYEDLLENVEVYVDGRDAWKRAKEEFKKPMRFDFERKVQGKWIRINFMDRVRFLKELQKEGIRFILRKATRGGCARIYIDEQDYERVEEIFIRLFL